MKNNAIFFAVQKAENVAEIYIFGDIVHYKYDETDVSADSLVQQIKGLEVSAIDVHINSFGGSVSDGFAIYNALREHPAKVRTYGDGFVASAALYPFMAGDERYANNVSAYYFHSILTTASGYAKDLRAAAEEIEKLTEIGTAAFTENSQMTADEVLALMDGETWLSAQEMLERGLATAIYSPQKSGVTQSAEADVMKMIFAQKQTPSPSDEKTEDKKDEQMQKETQKAEPTSIVKKLAGFKF
jgi:ATP-dependent Clp protease, protease subunit